MGKGRGWHGEPGRHADAARGIKTKGLTPGEKELRKVTREYLAPAKDESHVDRITSRLVRPREHLVELETKTRFEEIAKGYEAEIFEKMGDMVSSHGMIAESRDDMERFIHDEGENLYADLTQSIRSENHFLDGDDVLKVADLAFEAAAKDASFALWQWQSHED